MGLKKLFRNIKYLTKKSLAEKYEENSNIIMSLFSMYSKEYDIFVFTRFGLGESTIVAGYLNAFKKIHQKKIMLLVIGESRKSLFELYDAVDVVFEINQDIFDFVQKNKNKLSNLICVEDPYLSCTSKKDNIFHLIKDYFHLPADSEFTSITSISQNFVQEAEKLFNNLNLIKNNTMFINTEALCLGKNIVSELFWEKLAQKWKNQGGGEVVFNSKNEVVKGYKHVFIDLKLVIPFVNLCGKIVSVRTGLLDFIAANSPDIDLTALYPNRNNIIFKKQPNIYKYLYSYFNVSEPDPFLAYISSASLNNTFKVNNVKEYIVEENKEDEIIEKILSSTKSEQA